MTLDWFGFNGQLEFEIPFVNFSSMQILVSVKAKRANCTGLSIYFLVSICMLVFYRLIPRYFKFYSHTDQQLIVIIIRRFCLQSQQI